MNFKPYTTLAYVQIVAVIALCALLGELFFFLPKHADSEYEKRPLAKMPQFSWDNLLAGNYVDSLEQYFADNFPFRDQFVKTAFALESYRGFSNSEFKYYDLAMQDTTQIDAICADDNLALNHSTAPEITNTKGVIIHNGMAIELFGGNDSLAQPFIDVMNNYHQKLGNQTQLHVVLVPTHQEFYLPEEKKYASEKKNINHIYNALPSDVITVDAWSALDAHKKEYIFFNTDHHWTGLGAYHAYETFCAKKHFQPMSLSLMQRKSIKNYYGSLYRLTLNKALENNPDSVIYYKPPIGTTTYQYLPPEYVQKNKILLFAEYATALHAYSVFLGGDFPIVEINTATKNGKKAVLIKNSFGNPFAPYLIAHYEQIFVVDYRYYTDNLLTFIRKNNINDVIVLVTPLTANTAWHCRMLDNLFKHKNIPNTEDSLFLAVDTTHQTLTTQPLPPTPTPPTIAPPKKITNTDTLPIEIPDTIQNNPKP